MVRELPYQVNKARLIERIAELVKDKKIEGISEIRDESDREGMRVVIQLKKDEPAQTILNQLYLHTQMQVTFGINLVAIVENRPELLNLRDLLRHFLAHRREVILRRTRYELKQAEARAHILAGLLIALDHLDEVIELIRAAPDAAAAKEQLISRFALSDLQAQAILDMRLARLTGLERQKIMDEAKELETAIARFRLILAEEAQVKALIAEELRELKDKFGDDRKTEIIPQAQDFTDEDLIADEEMVVTISHRSYIKRTPLNIYRSQRRGGKGRMGMFTRENDFVAQLYVATMHSYFLVFTNTGRVFWIKVHEIPAGSPTAQGKAIVNLLQLAPEDKLATILPVREFVEGFSLVMATKRGVVKKTELMNFSRPRKGGIIAINLDEGDELVCVRLVRAGTGHLPGNPAGQGHPLPLRRSPGHRPGRPGRQGHRSRQERLGGGHGGGPARGYYPHGHRTGLWQTDPGRRLPPAPPGRAGGQGTGHY